MEQLHAQLEGVQAMQKTQAADEARMSEIAALLEKFKESSLAFDDLLVRKVVETIRVESAQKTGNHVQGWEPEGSSYLRGEVSLSINIKSCGIANRRR